MVAQLDSHYVKTRPARALARLISYACFEGRPLTTRGRWLNPLLQAAGKRIARRSDPPSADRPLFILGTGRSGTTVLGKVLSLHREVGWLNEPKLMWHIACGDEDLNGNYTLRPARYRLHEGDADETVRKAMHNLYATYIAATRNSRVLDKYPELVFRVPFVRAIFPDARFLLLIRNGYDTCRSISRWSVDHASEDSGGHADWWGTDRRKWHYLVDELVRNDSKLSAHGDAIARLEDHAHMAAVEWDLSMREGLRVMQEHPEHVHPVRYEDLTTQPDATLRAILDFAELKPDARMLDYAADTLRGGRSAGPLELPDCIAESFRTTMTSLGYAA